MRIGLFIPTFKRDYNDVSASIWIRCLQMKSVYEGMGYEVYINNPFRNYDHSIIFRSSGFKSYLFAKYLTVISKRVYWDTCVNYYDLHSQSSEKQTRNVIKISKYVDGIICSTKYIADKASKFNDSTFIMDDPIDTNLFYYTRKKINYDNPKFGWSGVSSKAWYLNRFRDDIKSVTLITDQEVNLDIPVNYVKWRYETFPEEIYKIDIALLPRDYDDPYNRGHSSFKALVFASMGIPIIANKLPSYEELAKYYDGIIFIEDYPCFKSALIALKTRDLDSRKVREYYSCQNQAKQLIEYLGSFSYD